MNGAVLLSKGSLILSLGSLLLVALLGMLAGIRYADARNQRRIDVLLEDQAISDARSGKFVNGEARQGGAMTIRGEVVDLSCHLWHFGMGHGHRRCAKDCVLEAEPVGLRTDDGAVFLLIGSHDKKRAYRRARDLVAERVEVTGSEYVRGGLRGVLVSEVKTI